MNRRLTGLGAAAGLALACLLPAAPAGAAPGPGSSFSGDLTGVSCGTARSCWAVGSTGNNAAIAEHWDGSAWSVVHLPAPRQSDSTDLPSISCTGLASCWAVGTYQSTTTSAELPYAEHWNGRAWSVVKLPHPAGVFVTDAVSVSCSSSVSCWAVGTAYSRSRPLLEYWNGHVWALKQAPAIGAKSTLEGVYCARSTDCWATGYGGKNGTLAAHWDGSAWSVTPTPNSGELLSTSCAGRDCMAVGDNAGRTLAERWNGSAWTVTHTWRLTAFLTGVFCTRGFHCMATGNRIRGRVFSEFWNGSGWHVVTPEWPQGSHAAALVGITCVNATDCWSVGSTFYVANFFSLIEHWNGTRWSIAA